MNLFKRFLKHEFDAEMFACVYTACILWLLSLFFLLSGGGGLTFAQVTVCIILSWVVSWVQKLLFWGDRTLSAIQRVLRSILWNLLPAAAILGTAFLLGWFSGRPAWVFWAFGAAVTATFFSWWCCIQLLCRDETEEWNALLTQFKQNASAEEEHHG